MTSLSDKWQGFITLKKQKVESKWVFDCVGEGWHQLLNDLFENMLKLGWDGDIDQVKEKFGALRIYISQSDENLYGLIEEAENQSLKICEKCGKRAKCSGWGTGWMKTLCEEHGEMWRNKSLIL